MQEHEGIAKNNSAHQIDEAAHADGLLPDSL